MPTNSFDGFQGPLSFAKHSRLCDNLEISRRHFLQKATATTGFAISLSLFGIKSVTADEKVGSLKEVAGGDATPNLFIEIGVDESVHITCHRSEMGQQTWTAMAQILADELEANWNNVKIKQAIGHPQYGDQNTDGSRSVRYNLTRLRTAGAAMRRMLETAAAAQWNVSVDECKAELGYVVHETKQKGEEGRKISFGALSQAAGKLALPALSDIKLKPRKQWRYMGQPVPSLTVPKIVQGQGTFGIDIQIPEMLYAVIARPPQLFSQVESMGDNETLKVKGVIKTHQLAALTAPAAFKPLGGVAVIAKDTWSAIKGRRALKTKWTESDNKNYDSVAFKKAMMDTASQAGKVRLKRGDVMPVLNGAERTIKAQYYVPHLSQSPMEPPMATARWVGDKVECWGCVQAPQSARRTVAQVCGVPEENVIIHVTWLGGGFGRKSKPDFFAEAALLAREMMKPVKVVWTREDDLQHGYFHTVSAQHLEAAIDSDGECTALLHRTVFPTISTTFSPQANEPGDGELGLGASDNPFAVKNLQLETGSAPAHIRIGWLRSVANVYHAFALQSFAAELATAAGQDSKDYLLKLIGEDRNIDPNEAGAKYDNYGSSLEEYPIDTVRLKRTLNKAAEMAGWGRKLPKGTGLGIAVHRSFVSYVATVIEVKVDDEGKLDILSVWSAMDAGTVVNPRHAEAQMEGGTLYGLSNALYGEISVKNGVVEQTNFPAWRVMRMNESPVNMQSYIFDSDAPPGGVGEPPTPPAAPALTNAIHAACGVRIRQLPIFAASSGDKLRLQDAQASDGITSTKDNMARRV